MIAGTRGQVVSAKVPVYGGACEETGVKLTQSEVASRVGWFTGITRAAASGMIADHWNSADVAVLDANIGPDGRELPSSAWMALRRLGWTAAPPAGVTVSDRVIRMTQEQAGRQLRSATWRSQVVAGIVSTWPADPAKRTPDEWDQVRDAIPGGDFLPPSVIRSRTRQVQAFRGKHGRLPQDLFELEPSPDAFPELVLAACDRQQATLERAPGDPRLAVLRVKLPACPFPSAYKDWEWVIIPLRLPPTVPSGAVLHLPVLQLTGSRVRAHLSFTLLAPKPERAGHVVAVGADWGLNTLLSAGPARLSPDRAVTALGHGARYRADGVLAKAARLRRQGEELHGKIARILQVMAGDENHPLAGRLAVLQAEAARVDRKRANLNHALAWSAARWLTDQALAAGATVIYLEDLRTMEAGGMGKTMNTRLSQTVRGKIAEHVRHLAGEQGIAVVIVPAAGTSKFCPRCLLPLKHCKSPDQPATAGWKWAVCACGWQGDRDMGAWQRIAARGLTHQTRTSTDRHSGMLLIRKVHPASERQAVAAAPESSARADRSKAGPTRRRTASRPAPRRRTAPSPASSGAGQRPEGHVTTARMVLPRAARRDQGVNAISDPILRRPHRARGAVLGAGFHLHAHASPPRWLEPSANPTG